MESQDFLSRVTWDVTFQGSGTPGSWVGHLFSRYLSTDVRSESNSAAGHELVLLALDPKVGFHGAGSKVRAVGVCVW